MWAQYEITLFKNDNVKADQAMTKTKYSANFLWMEINRVTPHILSLF